MSQYDWPSSRARAPAFPWDAQPRAPPRRGAPNLSDCGDNEPPAVAKPGLATTMALVPVQLGVGAFRAPIPRVMLATAVPPGSFGCGEASDAGESGATARSIFGFPSARGGASVASVSVSHSCAAFGAADDGAEVTSGAAQAAAQQAAATLQPLLLLSQPSQQPLQRAPAHFFTRLGPPPDLEMYYGSGAGTAQPHQEHMEGNAAALPPAASGRKRAVPEEWVTVERPPRVYRGFDEVAMAYEQPAAVSTVTREEVMIDTDAAMGWSLLAHLSAREREMLPACAATAHDAFQPYDAELHPMRRDHEHEE